MKLFGYERWYEDIKRDNERVGRKVKLKKVYNGNENEIRYDESDLKTPIEIQDKKNETKKKKDIHFITKLMKYREEPIKNKKFGNSNILFKLKCKSDRTTVYSGEEIIEKIEIKKQSKTLSDYNTNDKKKNNNSAYSRSQYAEKLSDLWNNEEDKSLDKDNGIFKYKDIEINIFSQDRYENFLEAEKNGKKAILYRVLSSEEINLKIEIYDKAREINAGLYNIIFHYKNLNNRTFSSDYFKDRKSLKELSMTILNSKNIKNTIKLFSEMKAIINKIQDNSKKKEALDYIYFLLKGTSNKKNQDNKNIFINQLMDYFKNDVELTENMIADFLAEELKVHKVVKRISKEKIKLENNKNISEEEFKKVLEDARIKTYITSDIHTNREKIVDESKTNKLSINDKVKWLLDNKDDIESKLQNILEKYNIPKLKNNIFTRINNNKKIDTNLFDEYKIYYKSILKNLGGYEYLKSLNEEKELYKIVYRYIKGRIDKIINNVSFKDYNNGGKQKIKDILCEKRIKEKILIKVKQYCLEHILYLGKIEHNYTLEANKNHFSKYHAEEELMLELLVLFSNANANLNKIVFSDTREGDHDFFGSELDDTKIKYNKEKIGISNHIFEKLEFIDSEGNFSDNFENYISEAFNIRSKIIHGEIEKGKNKEERKTEYSKVINFIDKMRVSNEEICKSLNFETLFDGGNKKELIEKINKKIIVKEKSLYIPNFSKLVPLLKKELKLENRKLNPDKRKILEPAFIYLNKVLYTKLMTNEEIEIEIEKDVKIRITHDFLQQEYKSAQVKASKGNKIAIKNYQNKIFDYYIKYIKKSFSGIFDFNHLITKEMENLGKEPTDSFIIESIKIEGAEITNDFEYTVIITALFADNIFLNNIRNRFFSTDAWLKYDEYKGLVKEDEYKNIIKILDEIIDIRKTNENLNIDLIRHNILTLRIKDLNLIIEAKRNELKVSQELIEWGKTNYEIQNIEEEIEKIKNWSLMDGYQNFKNSSKEKEIPKSIEKILENEDILNKFFEKIQIYDSNKAKSIKARENNENLKEIYLNQKKLEIFYKNQKDFYKEFNKLYNEIEDFQKEKIEEKNKDKEKEITKEVNQRLSDTMSKEIDENENYKKEVKNILRNTPKEYVEKYEERLKKYFDDKFATIYFHGKGENKNVIYKKELFNIISNENFDKLFEIFYKLEDNDLINDVNADILKGEKIEKTIKKSDKINQILTELNLKLSGYNTGYKKIITTKLKKKELSLTEYLNSTEKKKEEELETNYTYENFKIDYEEYCKYRREKDKVEFATIKKVYQYLIGINWKLAIQVARIERDIHHIINGLNVLYPNKYIINNDGKQNGKTRPFPKYEKNKLKFEDCYYKYDEIKYCKVENTLYWLGIDIKKDSELQTSGKRSIRNYISHFYLVRKPFEIPLVEIIDRTQNLLSYRTKYNNAVYNSVFEVFKKDVNLNYENLKKKFKLSSLGKKEGYENLENIRKYDVNIELMEPKKVSALELENYNDMVGVIKKLLETKILETKKN